MARMEMRTTDLLDISVGALAAEVAIAQSLKIDANRLQGCNPRIIEYAIEWRGKTTLEGPLMYGLTDSMSVTEIREWWQADPQHDDDVGTFERSLRHVKILGYMNFLATVGGNGPISVGHLQTTTWPGWDLIEGEFLNFFILNIGLSAVTTGILIDGFLHILGDWNSK